MFAADAQLDGRTGFTSTGDRRAHEGTDTFTVQHRKRIALQNIGGFVEIDELLPHHRARSRTWSEVRSFVPNEKTRLLPRCHRPSRRAGQLDHSADQVRQLDAIPLHRLGCNFPDKVLLAFISETMPTSGIMISGTILVPFSPVHKPLR